MKTIAILCALILPAFYLSQHHTALPHGTIFGTKPTATHAINASAIEEFMGKKTRISTAIRGRVIKITHQKGGWFEIDAGKGKVIAAHFREYDITIPKALRGRHIIAEGVAEKQFIADDMQHFAGDTAGAKKQHGVKTNPKQKLTFEVSGLMVE